MAKIGKSKLTIAMMITENEMIRNAKTMFHRYAAVLVGTGFLLFSLESLARVGGGC